MESENSQRHGDGVAGGTCVAVSNHMDRDVEGAPDSVALRKNGR